MDIHLSPREEEVIQLSIQGLTNDGIAERLGISIGTVHTYWLRLRLKVGGSNRTDTVARVIGERAERALRAANVEREDLADIVATQTQHTVDLRAAIALLQLALDQVKSTVWATDKELTLFLVANGEFPSTHFGVTWEAGKTVYEIFKTTDRDHPAIACHRAAIEGKHCNARLIDEFANMTLRVMPLRDEEEIVVGCISILNTVANE